MKPYIHDGWIYRFQDDKPEVIPSDVDKRELPKTLFKYFSLNKNLEETLTQEFLYAPHPDQLNDPFDCHYNLIDFDDENRIHSFTNGKYPVEEIRKMLDENNRDFIETIQYNFNIKNFQNYGLVSLSETMSDGLMWAYYGNNQGVCVEYEYGNFKFDFFGPFQMNYQDIMKPISYKSYDDISLIYQINIKHRKWEHEKEWRIMPFKRGEDGKILRLSMPDIERLKVLDQYESRCFKYDSTSIKRVLLGPKFFHIHDEYEPSEEKQVKIIYLKHNREIKEKVIDYLIDNRILVNIMGRDNKEFKLKPVKVELSKIDNFKYRMNMVGMS